MKEAIEKAGPEDKPVPLPKQKKVKNRNKEGKMEGNEANEEVLEVVEMELRKRNVYFIPGHNRYLLVHYLSWIYVWSIMGTCLVYPNIVNPFTNSAVELRIELAKRETWKNNFQQKPRVFMRKMVERTLLKEWTSMVSPWSSESTRREALKEVSFSSSLPPLI